MNTVPCAIIGLDSQARTSYEHFFLHCCEGRFTLTSNAADAAILLVDMDSIEGWELAARHPGGHHAAQQMVLIVSPGNPPKHGLFLEKPARASVLKDLLEQARNQLLGYRHPLPSQRPLPTLPATAHRLSHAMEQVPSHHPQPGRKEFNRYLSASASTPEQLAQESFDPGQHLAGALMGAWRLARRTGHMVEIRWHLSTIRICPVERRISTGMRDGVLRSLALTRFNGEIRELNGDDATWPQDAQTEPVEQVLWRVAIWTSRGRLPRGTAPTTLVRLADQPDLKRLLPTPHGIEIATLWNRQACTLEQTAHLLDIPAADVNLFYCAAQALELLRVLDDDTADAPRAVAPALGPAALTTAAAAGW